MGLLWVVSLLSNYASTGVHWLHHETAAQTLQPTIDIRQEPTAPEASQPLSDSLPALQHPRSWELWATIPLVSVVPVAQGTSAPQSDGQCAPPLATDDSRHYQIWLKDVLVGAVSDSETASRIAQKLREFLSQDDLRPHAIQPLISDIHSAVGINQTTLFAIDAGFGPQAEQPKLAAAQWASNLRAALGGQPYDAAKIQMAALGYADTPQTFQGTASWYGPYFHGRPTATGETYNQYDLTAAHKTLPFGTRLKVRNLLNEKTVVVRINDRGPYVGERSLDLSYAAAQCLGSKEPGVIPYEATILEKGTPSSWIAQTP